ncbi:MAG: NAD-dependent epimerase/dehydratase family protein [Candidatus Altiarchaeota archaeon]
MAVLVTGGSGFIGSTIVDKLLKEKLDVRVYDLYEPMYHSKKEVEFTKGSLLDLDALTKAMKDVDFVYHIAAIANVNDVFKNPVLAESVNTTGTINVLEAIRKSGAKRIIYASTEWVYSNTLKEVVDETTPPLAPTHLYTSTKLASEFYCQNYKELYHVPYTILRYGIPYGERARPGTVIQIFVEKALKGEPITILGGGMQYRQFVYVTDLAEGNVLAMKKIAENQIYNLSGKEKITIKQIAETVKDILGNVEIKYEGSREGDFSGKEVVSEKARKDIGWEPKITFEKGLKKYIDWYKKEGREIARKQGLI